jgi:hypothetical protein
LNKLIAFGESTFTFHDVVVGVELRAFVADNDEADENAPGAALNNGAAGGLIPPVVCVTDDLNPTLDWVLFHPLLVTPKLGVVFAIGEVKEDGLKELLENNEDVVPVLVVLVIDDDDDDSLLSILCVFVANNVVSVTDAGVVGTIDDVDDNDGDDDDNDDDGNDDDDDDDDVGTIDDDDVDDNDGCNGNTAIGGTSR